MLADLSGRFFQPIRKSRSRTRTVPAGFPHAEGNDLAELSWQAEAARLVQIPLRNGPAPAARWRNRFSTGCDSLRRRPATARFERVVQFQFALDPVKSGQTLVLELGSSQQLPDAG